MADMAGRGYIIFHAMSGASPIDFIAYHEESGVVYRVQVKAHFGGVIRIPKNQANHCNLIALVGEMNKIEYRLLPSLFTIRP